MTVNTLHIETLVDFIARQMDGEQVPPTGSIALGRLASAISAMQTKATPDELQTLGLRAIGVVIDRARSSIAAEETLRNFIQPGDRA